MTTTRSLTSWELAGIPFIVVVGSAMHFVFAWSGERWPVALVAAVNESVWEHLKLAFWPGLVWSLLEYRFLRPDAVRFWAAKGISLAVPPVIIVLVFYGYTGLAGDNYLVADIGTFVLAVVCGQIVSLRLVAAPMRQVWLRTAGIGLLFCEILAFSAFTYFPPPMFLFEDSRSGLRGIYTDSFRGDAATPAFGIASSAVVG